MEMVNYPMNEDLNLRYVLKIEQSLIFQFSPL